MRLQALATVGFLTITAACGGDPTSPTKDDHPEQPAPAASAGASKDDGTASGGTAKAGGANTPEASKTPGTSTPGAPSSGRATGELVVTSQFVGPGNDAMQECTEWLNGCGGACHLLALASDTVSMALGFCRTDLETHAGETTRLDQFSGADAMTRCNAWLEECAGGTCSRLAAPVNVPESAIGVCHTH